MKVGDLVVPSRKVRYDTGELTVWKTLEDEVMDQADVVQMGSLLLVIEVKTPNFRYRAEGWKKCVKVLTASGAVGWVGDGWISRVTTDV